MPVVPFWPSPAFHSDRKTVGTLYTPLGRMQVRARQQESRPLVSSDERATLESFTLTIKTSGSQTGEPWSSFASVTHLSLSTSGLSAFRCHYPHTSLTCRMLAQDDRSPMTFFKFPSLTVFVEACFVPSCVETASAISSNCALPDLLPR